MKNSNVQQPVWHEICNDQPIFSENVMFEKCSAVGVALSWLSGLSIYKLNAQHKITETEHGKLISVLQNFKVLEPSRFTRSQLVFSYFFENKSLLKQSKAGINDILTDGFALLRICTRYYGYEKC